MLLGDVCQALEQLPLDKEPVSNRVLKWCIFKQVRIPLQKCGSFVDHSGLSHRRRSTTPICTISDFYQLRCYVEPLPRHVSMQVMEDSPRVLDVLLYSHGRFIDAIGFRRWLRIIGLEANESRQHVKALFDM